MKTIQIAFAILLMPLFSNAVNPGYEQAMGESLKNMQAAQSIEDLQNVANQFQVIANVETAEWLPLYYHAFCHISMSFRATEKEQKDAYLDIAEKSVKTILEKQPQESEIMVLQAFLYTARLTVDPPTRGQQYMGLSGQAIGKAMAMNPKNPRAQYLQLANEMGMASFFGKDVSEACEKAKTLHANWDQFESPSPLHPQWGKGETKGLTKQCQ